MCCTIQPHTTQSITHVTEYTGYFLATVANLCQRVEECERVEFNQSNTSVQQIKNRCHLVTHKSHHVHGVQVLFVLSGFILAYITYLLLGALVFSAIERPVEETLKSDLSSLKAEFLNLSCINATALEVFLEKVLRANKYGVSVLENATLRTNWDLASSLFFANTMVTTVGEFHRNKVNGCCAMFV